MYSRNTSIVPNKILWVIMVSMVYRIGGFLTFKRNKILLGTMEVFLLYIMLWRAKMEFYVLVKSSSKSSQVWHKL
jgi:hypothetical protein